MDAQLQERIDAFGLTPWLDRMEAAGRWVLDQEGETTRPCASLAPWAWASWRPCGRPRTRPDPA